MPPKLNRRLDLEERITIPDGAGGFDVTWQKLGTHWAEVKARTGREKLIGERVVPTAAFKIRVRATPVGTPSRPMPEQRFTDGARIYAILAVTEANDSLQYLDCWAEEGKGE